MEVKLLCLTVVLLSSPLLTLCEPLFVLSAPNLLRVGSSENVFVEAQDYSGGAFDVKITVKNHPKKDTEILSKTVTLTGGNYFQILTDIRIPDDLNFFSDDPLEKQYVFLQAQFPSKTLEKVIMVSFQSGYIFVQTDKPIYTPASSVLYRIFSLTPSLKPLSQSGVTVEIMNPQGITVSSDTFYPVKGMRSGRYAIPEVASLGMWKVVTRYINTPQKTFTADFEVKEYVPPTFGIGLRPSRSFFYVDDESLTVDIEAKYLFGQKVEGNAFVVFGVMDGEKKTSIASSLQRVQIKQGKGAAELTREMITNTFPHINQLVRRSIYVSVSLLTESGSEMVEAERRGIQIVTSPYTIHLKKTPQFFKPGMPFSVSVHVTNPDQTPAENVEVEVNPGGVRGHTRANGIMKVTVNTPGGSSTLQITAKTKDPQLRDEQQAKKTMMALAYIPKVDSAKNYLHISVDSAELQIGDHMTVNLITGQSPGVKDQDYTYMILSKGQIVQANRFKRSGRSLVTLSLPVTKDMVPSFRFVAYYHVGSSEVVSDSVWVDVKDTCMGTLKLQVKNKKNTYEPGEKVELQITGDPGARVGLVVVDKAVHVLNKNRLTQTQIWDVIEKHDTGCTAGGGRDSMGVFSDSGLMFESSTAGGTDTRTAPECPFLSKRRRRSLGYDDDDYYTDSDDIESHTQFPESWLWEEIDLCENCPAPVTDKVITLKHSITTWQILAVSLSPTLGICVAEPEEIIVFKPFFIDLKIPYSAVRGEQLEIKAIIHNYTPRNLKKVRVEFMETENVCSFASKKGKYRTTVSVDKDSSTAVSYVIIPMTLGDHDIEVKASAYDSGHTDGVRKTLKVVSEGVLTPLHRPNVELNPVKNGENPIFFKAETPADLVPDTPANTYISITGQVSQMNNRQNFNLDVELSVEGRSRPVRFTITRNNVHLVRSEMVDINKDFSVTARGTGTATLSVLTLYYARPVEKKSDCTLFDLTVKMEKDPETKQGVIESYNFIMDFFYKNYQIDATMTILDIGILTGFDVEENDLKELSTGKERYIQKYELNKELSERGSLIVYLDKVLRAEKQRITFRMHKIFNVGLLQPAAVTIYEYYSPNARCTKFYHPERADGALYRLCKGDMCTCAEEMCSIQKHQARKQRFKRSHESGMDYVYTVTVLDVDLIQDSTIYDMKVERVLKEGTDDKKVEGKVRPFVAHPSFRQQFHLGLEKGKSYLIMGKSTDLSRVGGSLKYLLGEQTRIEFWPTREKSRNPEYTVKEDERYIRACESGADYVYKVSVVKMDLAQDSDIYHLKVDQVVKEGTDWDAEGKVRPFLAPPHCRELLGLVEGKSYLIMGKFKDLSWLGGSLLYIFGEHTWVEYWPTREEGQTREYRDQYIGISELQDILLRIGCDE